MFLNGKLESINDTAGSWSTLTRSRMMCDMVVLASTMMVAVLSSRISFSRGVGSWLSSSMRTDRVSLEMRNRRRSCSRLRRPVGILNIKKQRNIALKWRTTQKKWIFTETEPYMNSNMQCICSCAALMNDPAESFILWSIGGMWLRVEILHFRKDAVPR